MMKKPVVPMIQVGTSQLAIKEARGAINDILSSDTDNSTKVMALDTLRDICKGGHTSIQESSMDESIQLSLEDQVTQLFEHWVWKFNSEWVGDADNQQYCPKCLDPSIFPQSKATCIANHTTQTGEAIRWDKR